MEVGGGVVRHSGGLDDEVHRFIIRPDRLEHFLRALHADDADKGRRCNIHGTADERDLRAAQHRLTRDGVAHLSRGVVGDEADGVDALAGRACGDEDFFTRQVLLTRKLAQEVVAERLLRGQLALARVAAREIALVGRNHRHAAPLQGSEVLLYRRALEHVHVHRGRDHHGGRHREQGGGEHVVGDAVRHLREDVRRGWRDKHRVRALRERDMRHLDGIGALKGIGIAPVFRQRLKGDGGDERRGVLRHDDVNVCAQLDEHAREIGDFVRRDAACHTEQYIFSFQHGESPCLFFSIIHQPHQKINKKTPMAEAIGVCLFGKIIPRRIAPRRLQPRRRPLRTVRG